MAGPGLPELLERVYETGEVETEEGSRVPALPVGVGRDEALALTALVHDEGLQSTLEIGFAYGLSALAIAGAHEARGSGEHVAIDPHAATAYGGIGERNLRRAGLGGRVELHQEGSELVLPRLLAGRPAGFDLVMVDGRHHFDTTLVDLFYADGLLRDGGYIVVDDSDFPPVERALAYMLSNRAYDAVALPAGGLAVLRKLHSDDREWDHHVPFESLELNEWRRDDGERRRRPLDMPASTAAPTPAPAATLSFCITTRGPAERVRALLELMRPHADEIVLAVNRDGGLDTLDACADLADRRLTYEYEDSPSRFIGWALHQCSADWILRMDDDEVPSAALLRELPGLLRDRRPSELFIKRRWLHEAPDRMIGRPAPWNAEYQSRGIRNVPGTWRFDGRVHTDIRVLGERRHVEAPIYHLALLLGSREARAERAMAYELLRPGLAYGDMPVNGMYLPELVDRVELEPVPAEDVALIERVLAGAPAPAEAEGPPVSHASLADVDRYNASRRVDPSRYSARLEPIAPPDRMRPGAARFLEMRITNLGDEPWPGRSAEPLIRLGYRWRDRVLDRVVADGRTEFTETVLPGATTLDLLAIDVPGEAGDYDLEIDVLHEHVCWFDCAVSLRVRVQPDPRSLLVSSPHLPEGAFEGRLHTEADRLAGALGDSTHAADQASESLAALRNRRRWRAATLLSRPLDAARRRRR